MMPPIVRHSADEEARMKWNILGGLALVASAGMYVVGSNSGHLSELEDFFWVPLPLAVICLVLGNRGKAES